MGKLYLVFLRYNFVMSNKLTHLDEQGRARMVDVGQKPDTERIAVARGEIHMKKETLNLIRAGQIKKGDVLTVAQIAGISASKRTSELIPLCHPLPLNKVDVDLMLDDSLPGVVITATAKTIGKTGVEMEGEFVWHDHTETDEVFIVLKGQLEIELRDGNVVLEEGELFVVPKGAEH